VSAELDLEGLGLALQLAVGPDPVGAGPPQRADLTPLGGVGPGLD
jgi:hypothetical protein